jgi:glucans biosynthesis protein
MHGGAAGSGAPEGNRNALKHGARSAEALAWRRRVRELLREARELVIPTAPTSDR